MRKRPNGDLEIVARLLTDWALQDHDRRSLTLMLTILFRLDFTQALGHSIFPTGVSDVYYAKATGHVQMRPRCCLGHEMPRDEVTFLVCATESGANRRGKGGKIDPPDADEAAEAIRGELLAGKRHRARVKGIPPRTGGAA